MIAYDYEKTIIFSDYFFNYFKTTPLFYNYFFSSIKTILLYSVESVQELFQYFPLLDKKVRHIHVFE